MLRKALNLFWSVKYKRKIKYKELHRFTFLRSMLIFEHIFLLHWHLKDMSCHCTSLTKSLRDNVFIHNFTKTLESLKFVNFTMRWVLSTGSYKLKRILIGWTLIFFTRLLILIVTFTSTNYDRFKTNEHFFCPLIFSLSMFFPKID